MAKDLLLNYHEFSAKMTELLNSTGFTPPEGNVCAILLLVHPENPKRGDPAPVGGSLNYDKELKKWVPADQAEEAERIPS